MNKLTINLRKKIKYLILLSNNNINNNINNNVINNFNNVNNCNIFNNVNICLCLILL